MQTLTRGLLILAVITAAAAGCASNVVTPLTTEPEPVDPGTPPVQTGPAIVAPSIDVGLDGAGLSPIKGGYRIEDGEELRFAIESDADLVELTITDQGEPEVLLFSGSSSEDGSRRLPMLWTMPQHSFVAVARIVASNQAGVTSQEIVLTRHQPAESMSPINRFGQVAPPFSEVRELTGLPQHFRVRGWLDDRHIWGDTGGNPIVHEAGTGQWRALGLQAWGMWLSTDRTQLAYTHEFGLSVINMDGTGDRRLLSVRAGEQAGDDVLANHPGEVLWSPDGRDLILTVTAEMASDAYRYTLASGRLRPLTVPGRVVSWIDSGRILIEQRSFTTADGKTFHESGARSDLVWCDIEDAGSLVTAPLATAADGQFYEFVKWMDEDRTELVFMRHDHEIEDGPEGGYMMRPAQSVYGTIDVRTGLSQEWPLPPGVRLIPGQPTAGMWATKTAGELWPAEHIVNRLVDLGVVADGSFRPFYRLEHMDLMWGPHHTPLSDTVLTLDVHDPVRRQISSRTYLLVQQRDI